MGSRLCTPWLVVPLTSMVRLCVGSTRTCETPKKLCSRYTVWPPAATSTTMLVTRVPTPRPNVSGRSRTAKQSRAGRAMTERGGRVLTVTSVWTSQMSATMAAGTARARPRRLAAFRGRDVTGGRMRQGITSANGYSTMPVKMTGATSALKIPPRTPSPPIHRKNSVPGVAFSSALRDRRVTSRKTRGDAAT